MREELKKLAERSLPEGKVGPVGAPGKDGTPGRDGKDSDTAKIVEWIKQNVSLFRGADGAEGKPGPAGEITVKFIAADGSVLDTAVVKSGSTVWFKSKSDTTKASSGGGR